LKSARIPIAECQTFQGINITNITAQAVGAVVCLFICLSVCLLLLLLLLLVVVTTLTFLTTSIMQISVNYNIMDLNDHSSGTQFNSSQISCYLE
jgi:hypothetical protein